MKLPITINRGGDVSLQEQIRRELLQCIVTGALPPGTRVPSSRQLSEELALSRNTVAAAYQKLVLDGHLEARDRSGYYVAVGGVRTISEGVGESLTWGAERSSSPLRGLAAFPQLPAMISPDWHRYPYPFVDGSFDQSLFPIGEWREATRRALAVADVSEWAFDQGEADDPMLVEEIRSKVLPLRGITARPDEVLVTTGAQHGLHLVVELLVRRETIVGLENPCNPELRQLIERHGASVRTFAVDEEGLIPDKDKLVGCDLLFLSPVCQRPVGATLSQQRRELILTLAAENDITVVEDDYQWEVVRNQTEPMAVLSDPKGAQVIYSATLAQPMSSASRLGVLVGPAEFVKAARQYRRMTSRSPARTTQRTFAYMLALGLYGSAMRRIEAAFRDRVAALHDALNHYLPTRVTVLPAQLGSAAWITGPDDLDAGELARRLMERGVLIESVRPFFRGDPPRNVFRLGVTGIAADQIRHGVKEVAEVFFSITDQGKIRTKVAEGVFLDAAGIKRACAGQTLLCQTVYGEPCTIELKKDGRMVGSAGFANEDRDEGRWWIENNRWHRQWHNWAYGEERAYFVRVEGKQIQWFDDDRRMIDQAVLT
ncbi:MAG: PLP-dependent aminotransferase family protein [Pseudomonadota bacterium]